MVEQVEAVMVRGGSWLESRKKVKERGARFWEEEELGRRRIREWWRLVARRRTGDAHGGRWWRE